MKYLANILVPLLLQLLFTWIIIEATRGGGSFVGLGAMLVALVAVPLTAIWNFVRVRRAGERSPTVVFLGSILTAFVLPAVVLGLFALQAILA